MSEDSSIVGNTDIGELKKGDIAILARLSEERPEDKSYPSNQKTESNVRVSLRSGNSVVYQTRNININLLTHVDIEGENNFWVKFDESLRPLKVEAKKDSGTKGMDTDTTYATLSWMLNPGQKATFSMITPSIEITGKGDPRTRHLQDRDPWSRKEPRPAPFQWREIRNLSFRGNAKRGKDYSFMLPREADLDTYT